MPSFILCLRQLTALTHHMAHRFSLTSAHSAQRGFCCVINMKSRIICSQSLFLGATYQGLSTSFQIYFCNPLTKFYPSQYLPFLSHTAHAFFSASIHSPSPLLHSLCTLWTLIRRRLVLVSKLAFLISVVVELESWFSNLEHWRRD